MQFYIIWNPDSKLPPKKTYKSQQEAEKVAKWASAKHPGKIFYVLKAYGHAQTPTEPQPVYTSLCNF